MHVFKSDLSPEKALSAISLLSLEERAMWWIYNTEIKVRNYFFKANGNKFQIIKPSRFRYPLKPYFYGSVSKDKEGSKIEGTFAIPFWVKIFLAFWATGLVTMGGNVIINLAADIITDKTYDITGILLLLFILLVFIGMPVGMFALSLQLRKQDEQAIIEFIKTSCHATHEVVE